MMKYKILFKKKYKWNYLSFKKKSILFKTSKDFAKIFLNKNFNYNNLSEFEFFLRNSGSFNNFIYEDEDYVICSVDKLNSDNIFYSFKQNILFISNDIKEILENNFNQNKIDKQSKIDLKLLGYVLGNKTIIEGISSLQAGQYLFTVKKNEYFVKNYFNFYSKRTSYTSREEAINRLKIIEDKIFNELIERNKDKKILLALSGGLDSRYVLSSLLKRNFKNILVYSYGTKIILTVTDLK